MDDLLALLIRILDPIVQYLGPHAVAAVAILGGVATFISSRKQRARERRLESKVDLLIRAGGHAWNAEIANTRNKSAYSGQRASSLPQAGKSLVRHAAWFTAPMGTVKFISRSVGNMKLSKTWIIGLLGYAAFFIKEITGYEIPLEMQNMIADLILLVIPLIAMIANMKKGDTNEEHYGDHGPAV